MIVLNQDGVVESGTVVAPTPAANGEFFQSSPARRRLSRVVDARVGAGNRVNELPRQRSNTR